MRTINNSFIFPPLTSDLIDSAAATADVARRMRRRCVRRLDARPVLPVTDSTHKFKPKPRARQMAAQRCQLDNNLSNGWRGGVGVSSGLFCRPPAPSRPHDDDLQCMQFIEALMPLSHFVGFRPSALASWHWAWQLQRPHKWLWQPCAQLNSNCIGWQLYAASVCVYMCVFVYCLNGPSLCDR